MFPARSDREAGLATWLAHANDGVRCLEHWVGED
jgi:hypothetical protein